MTNKDYAEFLRDTTVIDNTEVIKLSKDNWIEIIRRLDNSIFIDWIKKSFEITIQSYDDVLEIITNEYVYKSVANTKEAIKNLYEMIIKGGC